MSERAESAVSQVAGRELDARVAVEVMGWRLLTKREMARGFRMNPPAYSTDIAAAWEVFEKMTADGWLVEVTGKSCHPGQWCAHAFSADGERFYDGVADTAPLAICLAALATLGVPPDSEVSRGS